MGGVRLESFIKPILLIGLCFTIGAAGLAAQQRNELGSWIGVSTGTPTLIGKTEHVSLIMTGVRYSRTVLQRPTLTLRYTVDVIPIARLTYPLASVSGKGAAPLGFEISFRPDRRVQPAVVSSGGFIYFDQSLPSDGGARFNFSADLGIGIRIYLGHSIHARGEYKYHHLSNGYRAPANPGFDSNLMSIGLSISP